MIELKGEIGKYKILRKLGSGGFGTVYLGEDTFLNSYRAIKVPHRVGQKVNQLLRECVVQTKLLDHPNIVKLLTVDIIDGNIMMVMEYIEGVDLETMIDKEDSLTVPVALKYFRQILSALAFAEHFKIVHRDIRPSNILIDKKDDIKITDFGTSTLLENRQFATTKIGSPPYMAPEQFEGKAVLASDIYSAGCLFYEMVTGFPPIVLANPMEIYKRAKAGDITPLKKKNEAVSDKLNSIIMKMLEPELKDRFKNSDDVLTAIESMEQGRDADEELELKRIRKRLHARKERQEYLCWNCRKAMPGKLKVCLYCGSEQ
jgi:serine/threonine-protein kinase